MNGNIEEIDKKIPPSERDGSLKSRLIPILLCGFAKDLDRESDLYLLLFVRFIDEAFKSYINARELIIDEIKDGDKLKHRFEIISQLENILLFLNRAIKSFSILTDGVNEKGIVVKKGYNLLSFVEEDTIEKLKRHSVSFIRNRIEHINEDIYSGKAINSLFLDVDDNYEKMGVNKKWDISFIDLILIMNDYHNFVLEIFDHLPYEQRGGIYYYHK